MKWAVEIKKTGLERRNLVDLLMGLGFEVVDGIGSDLAFTMPSFEQVDTTEQVWSAAKELREAMIGPAEIDPDFTLGAVIDYSTSEPTRHHFLEAKVLGLAISFGTVTARLSPPQGLSEEKLVEWEAARAEREYQARLEAQLSKLEPAFREPRAAKMLELLKRDTHTGESLNKIYELAEGHRSEREKFHAKFGVSKDEFKRFGDAVHNPAVSGDLARHAYEEPPKTSNPMTIGEAERFVVTLAEKWLATVRKP